MIKWGTFHIKKLCTGLISEAKSKVNYFGSKSWNKNYFYEFFEWIRYVLPIASKKNSRWSQTSRYLIFYPLKFSARSAISTLFQLQDHFERYFELESCNFVAAHIVEFNKVSKSGFGVVVHQLCPEIS